ncbi:unnamed protein product [Rangifer tarandus platyrhynchus]|uniref:Uncharacterized protein n=1 Tax=Rangifer tarandus platyrhynchus TaxID=3082113 RepID=A0AC59YJT1_RANTA
MDVLPPLVPIPNPVSPQKEDPAFLWLLGGAAGKSPSALPEENDRSGPSSTRSGRASTPAGRALPPLPCPKADVQLAVALFGLGAA